MNDVCAVALKEWSATVVALQAGRQIILLRKGGLLDPEGAFALEYSNFWLAPTRFHQDETLVKPQHRDLLQAPFAGEQRVLEWECWARVEQTWTVAWGEAAKLSQLQHIWSERWLESRFDYQPEKPLLVVALRVYVSPSPQIVPFLPEYAGCRSWIELREPLPVAAAAPAQSDESFRHNLEAVRRVLGP